MAHLDPLESRKLLASVTWQPIFTDPGNTFASYHSEISNFITLAGNEWASLVPDERTSSGAVTLKISVEFSEQTTDPGSRMSASSFDNIQVGTTGNLFDQTAMARARYGDAPHNTVDATLVIQPSFLSDTLWFDPNPASRGTSAATPMPAGKIDAYSAILHEMGHIFAFNGDRDSDTYALLDSTFQSTFDTDLSVIGGKPYFMGAHAEAANGGQPVPLTPGNPYHVGSPTGAGAALLDNLMNGVQFNVAQRYFLGDMEKAIAADVVAAGTRPPVVPPQDTPHTVTFTGHYTYPSASGTSVVTTILNGGTGVIVFPSSTAFAAGTAQDPTSLKILGTNKKSIVTLGANVAVNVPNLTLNAAVATLDTHLVTLTGTVTIPGAVTLTLGGISSATVTIGNGAACKVATIGAVSGSTLSVVSPATLTTGAISSSTFSLSGTAGTMATFGTLSGATLSGISPASVKTGAVSASTVTYSGKSPAYTFGAVSASALTLPASKSLTMGSTSGSLVRSGTLAALVQAGSFSGSLLVTGDITKATFGTLTGATVSASGNIASLTATMATHSAITAGLATPMTAYPATQAYANAKASIKTIKVTNFSDTLIIAPTVGTATLGTVTTSNAGRRFGVYTHALRSLTASSPAMNVKKKGPFSTSSGDFAVTLA